MASRRSGARRGGRPNRTNIRDCYSRAAGDLEDRPAFDSTPFDSTSGASVWDTLPTQSIFDSESPRSPNAWLSSPQPSTSTSNDATASSYSGAAGPSGLSSTGPSDSCSPAASSARASSWDSSPYSSPYTQGSGSSRFADESYSLSSRWSRFNDNTIDDANDDDFDDYNMYSGVYNPNPPQGPIVVDTSPLPPWKPFRASERLDDPNNPPPIFHPMFSNEWRTDPDMSEEIRYMYNSSGNEHSENHCIFDYGKLSEFNTQNLYDAEKFRGQNDEGGRTPAYKSPYCTEVFGDPHEALDRPTDEVPDKYRKEKWKYYELKKRLELFKELGMETDLVMYDGLLERMEADPWTGDTSGEDFEVFVPGSKNDPYLEAAMDDELLERMEALTNPQNEDLQAFYTAMGNPPPPQDEYWMMHDHELEEMERLVNPENEGRQAFYAAMASATAPTENSELNESFHTCPEGDDTQMFDTDLNDSFLTCPEGDDFQMGALDTTFSLPESTLNTTFTLPESTMNTSFTISDGLGRDFPPGIGPDSC